MKFILVIFISYHIESGVGTQQIEFNNARECRDAEILIVKDFERTPRSAGYRAITTSCLAKSK
jgi:hypothetical protein